MLKLRNYLQMDLENRNPAVIVAYVFSSSLYGGSWLQLDDKAHLPLVALRLYCQLKSISRRVSTNYPQAKPASVTRYTHNSFREQQ